MIKVEVVSGILVKVILEFLECGFGYILGNVLCCIFFFFLFGVVVVEVEIEGVEYEYSILEGL